MTGVLLRACACGLLFGSMAPAAENATNTLSVPQGFVVETVAAPPLVTHPVMAGFDDRGRLFVADNAGLNLNAADLEKQLPNLIRLLEDTDGDGRFDRSTVFADKMTFPQGAAWFRGSLYVASPPYIWRLTDTNDDGVADKREQLVQKFGYIGNAADIHGCFITPTGRIAWCDGRHGHEFKDADGKTVSKGLAARIFSCLPDGSDVQVFCGGGMDNPVEITFTGQGDTIGTLTFYNPDDQRHDAICHFVYGGVYPKKHPCTSEFQRTGELMPALSRFGVTAPSGITRYDDVAFGEDYRDNLFSTHFNSHKVMRHVLSPQGSTFSARDEDFLTSTNADFHPTDVLTDADGSLLVLDTGGWFRIGCPASQIAKPEIKGAIHRIRRQGAKKREDPRGLKIDWARTSDTELADLLADPRPAVADRAIEHLVTNGDGAMGSLATALFEITDIRARERAVWTLVRIGSENARLLLRQAMADDEAPVRQAAIFGAGDLRDAASVLILIEVLGNDQPPVRRAAATALGRLKLPEAIPAIFKALARPVDRFEEHALIYALIEINNRQATLPGLKHESPAVRRAALIALDQMTAGNLTREDLAPLLATTDAALLHTIIEVLGRHPNWADELSGLFSDWLARPNPSDDELSALGGALTALLAREAVQQQVCDALLSPGTPRGTRLVLLDSIADCETSNRLARFQAAVAANLESQDPDVLRQSVSAATALDTGPLAAPLVALGDNDQQSAELRLAALAAAAKATLNLRPATFAFLDEQLTSSPSLRNKLLAAEALGGARLTDQQKQAIVRRLDRASALELGWLLRAFEGDTNTPMGTSLLAALEKNSATGSISADRMRTLLAGYPSNVQAAGHALVRRLAPSDSQQVAQLEAIVKGTAGDATRGEEIFFSQRAACSACHRVGDRGERIGPELTKVGQIRARRDLAEAILFPGASLVRGFESFRLVTSDGKVHAGLLTRETAAAVHLRNAERQEIIVSREEIDELVPSPISIMPQGLDKILSTAELCDLVTYLQGLK